MASSNTLKDQILALFPDNNTKEISAADMRIFVETIFNNKEEIVVKAIDEADMKLKKAQIFENSIVLITGTTNDNGVYVSRANNPISLLQLDKIASIEEGFITPDGPIAKFMYDFNHYKNYLNAVYSYDGSNISRIEFQDQGATKYTIDFSYTGSNITQKSILATIGGQMLINFEYTGNNITNKTYVYV